MSKAIVINRDELVRNVSEFLLSLQTHDNSLLNRFTEAVNDLNAQNWQAVKSLMDDNVVLTGLDHPTTFRGKEPVLQYIRNKIARDQPVLTPIDVNPNSTTGVVDGTAFWQDNDNGVRTNRKITYKFVFSWHVDTKQWFLLNLSGSPD